MNSEDDSDSLIKEVEIAWDKIDWDEYMLAAIPEITTINKMKRFIKDKCKKIFNQ